MEDRRGLSLDAGPFVAAIEYATGREAPVVGKPAQAFFELVLGDLGVEPSEAAMVGDDVETDVGGAIDAGLAGVLVRTGKYREELRARVGVEPTRRLRLDRGRPRPAHLASAGHGTPRGHASDHWIQAITERLDSLARELDSEPDEQRAAELVREASELAAEAGQEVERALRAAPRPGRTPPPVSDYPEDLRELVDDYLERAPLLGRPGDGGPGRGDALLAARRRQADPAGAGAGDGALDRARAREVLPAAAAIELIHTYSLIHDDLPAMDDDELRRGMPTSHVKFGENVAILAGDGLFAEAMRLFCERQQGEPERVVAGLGELVKATGVSGMVGGQYVDVTTFDLRDGWRAERAPSADPEALREMHALKTGRLIAASVGVVLCWRNGRNCENSLPPFRR